MGFDNERKGGKPNRRSNYGSDGSRERRAFRDEERRSSYEGGAREGEGRERRSFQSRGPSWTKKGEDQPRGERRFDRGEGSREGGRPRYPSSRPYGERSERRGEEGRGERPRFNRDERPRFDRGDRPDFRRNDRPDFRRDDQRGERPRFNREDRPRFERSERPRFDRDERPRFNREGGRDERPRFRRDDYSAPSRRVALGDRDVHRVNNDDFSHSPREQFPEVEMREDRLEGRNPVQEAIKAGRTIDKLWVLRSAEGKVEPALLDMVYAVRDAGGIVIEVEKRALDKMSQTHAHQGIIAQTAMHEYYEIEEILAELTEKNEKPFILLLDEIQDAYNLGSILRIADAAGVHAVVFPKRRAIGLDAVVAKASAGAIEHVKCCRVNNLVQTIETLKNAGVWIVGTAMDGETFYEGERLNDAIAIVVGSEGEGMRPLVSKHCDFTLSIPMLGQVNSLNAAVATGIIVFEAAKQRKKNE